MSSGITINPCVPVETFYIHKPSGCRIHSINLLRVSSLFPETPFDQCHSRIAGLQSYPPEGRIHSLTQLSRVIVARLIFTIIATIANKSTYHPTIHSFHPKPEFKVVRRPCLLAASVSTRGFCSRTQIAQYNPGTLPAFSIRPG